jgi:uncharacterized protein YicC (UPF0701 family)
MTTIPNFGNNNPCITDPEILSDAVRRATRRARMPFEDNARNILGANITPDVLTELTRLTTQLGASFESAVARIALLPVQAVMTALDSLQAAAIAELQRAADAAYNAVTAAIQDAAGDLLNGVNADLAHVTATINNLVNEMTTSISNIITSAQQELNNISRAIENEITQIAEGVNSATRNLIGNTVSQVTRCQ